MGTGKHNHGAAHPNVSPSNSISYTWLLTLGWNTRIQWTQGLRTWERQGGGAYCKGLFYIGTFLLWISECVSGNLPSFEGRGRRKRQLLLPQFFAALSVQGVYKGKQRKERELSGTFTRGTNVYLLETYCAPVCDAEVSMRPNPCSHGISGQKSPFWGLWIGLWVGWEPESGTLEGLFYSLSSRSLYNVGMTGV